MSIGFAPQLAFSLLTHYPHAPTPSLDDHPRRQRHPPRGLRPLSRSPAAPQSNSRATRSADAPSPHPSRTPGSARCSASLSAGLNSHPIPTARGHLHSAARAAPAPARSTRPHSRAPTAATPSRAPARSPATRNPQASRAPHPATPTNPTLQAQFAACTPPSRGSSCLTTTPRIFHPASQICGKGGRTRRRPAKVGGGGYGGGSIAARGWSPSVSTTARQTRVRDNKHYVNSVRKCLGINERKHSGCACVSATFASR
jgi:hypothetical protein